MFGKSFYIDIVKRYEENREKWGNQSREVVFAVLVEEIGEVARALLNRFSENKEKDGAVDLRKECVDAAAVLWDIYDRADELVRKTELEGRG